MRRRAAAIDVALNEAVFVAADRLHQPLEDPTLAGNAGHVARVAEIDAAKGAWTALRRVVDVLDALNQPNVSAGRIYTAKDIAEDPHYRARGIIERVTTAAGLSLEVPGIVPKLSLTPGAIVRRAPTLGEDNDAVLRRFE